MSIQMVLGDCGGVSRGSQAASLLLDRLHSCLDLLRLPPFTCYSHVRCRKLLSSFLGYYCRFSHAMISPPTLIPMQHMPPVCQCLSGCRAAPGLLAHSPTPRVAVAAGSGRQGACSAGAQAVPGAWGLQLLPFEYGLLNCTLHFRVRARGATRAYVGCTASWAWLRGECHLCCCCCCKLRMLLLLLPAAAAARCVCCCCCCPLLHAACAAAAVACSMLSGTV
jgi:hypothetical protein